MARIHELRDPNNRKSVLRRGVEQHKMKEVNNNAGSVCPPSSQHTPYFDGLSQNFHILGPSLMEPISFESRIFSIGSLASDSVFLLDPPTRLVALAGLPCGLPKEWPKIKGLYS